MSKVIKFEILSNYFLLFQFSEGFSSGPVASSYSQMVPHHYPSPGGVQLPNHQQQQQGQQGLMTSQVPPHNRQMQTWNGGSAGSSGKACRRTRIRWLSLNKHLPVCKAFQWTRIRWLRSSAYPDLWTTKNSTHTRCLGSNTYPMVEIK